MSTVQFKPCVSADERIKNIRSAMLRGLPTAPVLTAHDRTMVLCCYGPSLRDSLDAILASKGDVYTVSGAHGVLLEAGIVPRGHIDCEPRAHKAGFVRESHAGVTYLMASCCHPDAFKALEGREVALWHSDQSSEEAQFIWAAEPGAPLVLGLTAVGTRAMCLGTSLGYRRFEVYGMDCSFRVEGVQHAGRHPNPNPHEITVLVEGKSFRTTMNLVKQVEDFMRLVQQTPHCTYHVHGDGLLQHILRTRIRPKHVAVDETPETWGISFLYHPKAA